MTQPGEAEAAFHLRLRARGVRDLAVLRAFERVPRARFVAPAYAEMVARDLPVPLRCGQTSHESWLSALAVEALNLEPGARVLAIGSGSGYVTAVLAQIAGEVIGLERFAGLAETAQSRLQALGVARAAVVCGDGLALTPDAGVFDRVIAHGVFADPSVSMDRLMDHLAPDGRLVAAHAGGDGQMLTCWDRRQPQPVSICASRYAPLIPGLAAAL